MKEIPGWWLNASGAFFILGTAAMLAMLVLLGILVQAALSLTKSIKSLTERVERIGERVESVSKQVQTITETVNVRTQGLARMVDDSADKAFNAVDRFGPIVLGVALIFKLKNLFSKRR